MNKSIKKNFMYNLLFQIVTLLMPLITVPYVSRILGKEGIGICSYTLSITQYFMILGTLGISIYGSREIAYVRDDKEKMSKTFWSITFLKAITASISLIVYIIAFAIKKEYCDIYLIQAINIIAVIIDISWLYAGLEKFEKIVIRNLIVKIVGVSCIFIFVKSYEDLYKYISINAVMTVLGNLVMWMYLPATVSKIKIKFSDIIEHFIPVLQLFIPQIATQIYLVLDKTMLGILSNIGEVGLYEQSEKIVKLALALVTSLGIVMLPRMSNTFISGDNEKMNLYLNKCLQWVCYISIPMALGLAAISNEFVPWFFGKDFKEVSYLMIILTPILFFIAISNVLGIQYLLPSNRSNEFTASVTIGAIINVILNFILIPKYKAFGTCIATVISEFVVTSVQYVFLRKNIKNKILLKCMTKFLIAAIIMFIVVRFIGINMGAKIITTLVQCVVGVVIYEVILFMLKEEINQIIINNLITKFRIRKLLKL